MQTFSKTDYLKLATFLLGCTTLGFMIFYGLLGLHPFFSTFLTVVGTQFALKFLGELVIDINCAMTKVKKL